MGYLNVSVYYGHVRLMQIHTQEAGLGEALETVVPNGHKNLVTLLTGTLAWVTLWRC